MTTYSKVRFLCKSGATWWPLACLLALWRVATVRRWPSIGPGRFALFEYLEDLESGTGEEIELDVIAICCDYSEYSSAIEAAKEHSDWEKDNDATDEENEESALEYLRDNTQVIEHDEGIIIASF